MDNVEKSVEKSVAKNISSIQKLELDTMAAIGVPADECIDKFVEKYPECSYDVAHRYLNSKKSKESALHLRKTINNDIGQIPIANRAVQVKILGDILSSQNSLSDQLSHEGKEGLAVQLLKDAVVTVKEISNLTGTAQNVVPAVMQDNRQVNILNTVLGNVPMEGQKEVLANLGNIVRELKAGRESSPVIEECVG